MNLKRKMSSLPPLLSVFMPPSLSVELTIVHDYLVQMGGAERVVATMAKAYPSAPIYTSATDYAHLWNDFQGKEIHNTWMQCLPKSKLATKAFFPLYPFAFQAIRLPANRRAVWISASTFAKMVPVPTGCVSFLYCHSPTRFLWDTDRYVGSEVANPIARAAVAAFLPALRRMDRAATARVNYVLANSENVRHRIQAVYGRDSTVIHPPVDVNRFKCSPRNAGYYLILSRLIAYKGIDRAVQAFRGLNRDLHIVGDGTDRERLEKMAPPNVRFLGRLSEQEIESELAGCKALIFPGEEDFGITPVEAQACGKPVIAYAAGGALETVVDGVTGLFFSVSNAETLRSTLLASEQIDWDFLEIRKNAERFSEQVFLSTMTRFIEEKMNVRLS
jgi:glycosyltransferase involved in cell wall biosynthesis